MKSLLKLWILFAIIKGYSQDNYQKVNIFYKSETDLQLIIKTGEIDHFKIQEGVFLQCDIPEKVTLKIKNLGFKVEVIEPNLMAYYQKKSKKNLERNPNDTSCIVNTYTDPVNYNAGSMAGYLTYTECLAELDQMKSLYPNLISTKAPISTFTTFENRPIHYVKISDNPNSNENEKKVLYTALHHAREPGSMQQLIYFMWYLLENYESNPEIKALLNNTEIFCVPVVNPDGYVYNQTTNPNGGGMWRKNRRNGHGVDNNRNYGYQWGTVGISNQTNSDVYCGTEPFSEPETKAIKWLSEQNKFIASFNSHSYSNLLLSPFGYSLNASVTDENIFKGLSNEMVKFNKYNNIKASELYEASGSSDDWLYQGDLNTKPKVIAFTPEIGEEFWESPAEIKKSIYNMMYPNMMLLRCVHNYATFANYSSNLISQTNYAFPFSLKRLGIIENQNFIVSIVPISSNIQSVENPKTFSNLSFGNETFDTININLASGITNGTPVKFKVEINNGLYVQTETITKYFGTIETKLNETGTNLNQWVNNYGWGNSTSTYYSPPSSITDSPSGKYTPGVEVNIKTINPISLLNAVQAELVFYAKWDMGTFLDYDYVQLEVSKDNGLTWIPQCGKFTTTGDLKQDEGKPLYEGIQATWVKEVIPLNDYLNENILIRFKLKSSIDASNDGFYIDDLKVDVIPNSNLSISESVLYNTMISPNPVCNWIQLNTINSLDRYKIIDISGRVIRNENLNSEKIDVSDFSDGIYTLILFKDNSSKQFKFIVKK